MPVRRLTEEEKARRKAERQLIREQKKAAKAQEKALEKARKKAMRDALKQQRAEKKKIANEKKANKVSKKANKYLSTLEKQMKAQADFQLFRTNPSIYYAEKEAKKEAKKLYGTIPRPRRVLSPEEKQMKIDMKNAVLERKRIRQLKKEAKVAMMPAEKSVMKSSFIGALLPTQTRRLSSAAKAEQLKEQRRIRREGIVSDMMARRAIVSAPAPAAPRGRGRPVRVQNII